MKTDQKQLSSIMNAVEACSNPFHGGDDNLYNISTGKAASNETKSFLLNVIEIGARARDEFIQNCVQDPKSFERPISRQRIFTFASEGATRKKKSSDGIHVEEVKMERNLMGRLLAVALDGDCGAKLDMELVFRHPLTPVPLCFSHLDGSLNKTTKSVLFEIFESRTTPSRHPSSFDVNIIDGFFYLHLLVDPPSTFGRLAQHLLIKMCSTTAKRVDIVFDRVVTPSIKDSERDRRTDGERSVPFSINGPQQKRPPDFLKALRNDHFKREFVKFLTNEWSGEAYAPIIGSKTIFVTSEELCYSYRNLDGIIKRTEEGDMKSNHEEADSRMLAHLATIQAPSTVSIRTADSDVLAICIGNPHLFDCFECFKN